MAPAEFSFTPSATNASATIKPVPAVPRVLVTRSPHQASALADRLRELGCDPILIPTIETVAPTSFEALDKALAKLNTFHWLLFTSANAVEAFADRRLHKGDGVLKGTGFSPSVIASKEKGASAPEGAPTVPASRQGGVSTPPLNVAVNRALAPEGSPSGLRIAAIGPATAHALEQLGLKADLLPPQAIAESLTEALLPQARQPDGSPTRFLLIRAEEAREHLPETLRAAGAEVTIASAYRTVIPKGAAEQLQHLLTEDPPDAITFTSSSTARNLFALLEATGTTLPLSVVRASIGPITSATLDELNHPPHVESPEATVAALAETLVKYLRVPRDA